MTADEETTMTATMSTAPTGVHTISLTGDLDSRSGIEVTVLLRLTQAPHLCLDVTAVGQIYADGLRALMLATRKAQRGGLAVTVTGARPTVALMLSMAGIRSTGDDRRTAHLAVAR
ncbi:MAG TPA: STAS domain-containing protein [Acidimicrobiales bacterium]|nr:STAS domain-containing protein [Acidimicrobiales bacterium]